MAPCAGYRVVAGDLFADADLGRDCQATPVEDYPRGLAAVVAGPQPGGWLYTGALENSANLVAEMAAARPLLGNGAEVLRQIRDPGLVAKALQSAGIATPAILPHTSPRPATAVGCESRGHQPAVLYHFLDQ